MFQLSKICPPEIDIACHNNSTSSTISGPFEAVQKFVARLTAGGIFAKEVQCSNIAYHSRYIAKVGKSDLNNLLKGSYNTQLSKQLVHDFGIYLVKFLSFYEALIMLTRIKPLLFVY